MFAWQPGSLDLGTGGAGARAGAGAGAEAGAGARAGTGAGAEGVVTSKCILARYVNTLDILTDKNSPRILHFQFLVSHDIRFITACWDPR